MTQVHRAAYTLNPKGTPARKIYLFPPPQPKPPELSLLLLGIKMKFRSIVWYFLRKESGFVFNQSNFFALYLNV